MSFLILCGVHWFKGSKRWLSTIPLLKEPETSATSLWFNLLILCTVKRNRICSDVRIYLTIYKATLKAVSIGNTRPVFCHAQPQHFVHYKNILFRSPIFGSNTVDCLLPFGFFCFSIKIFLQDDMNESGFAQWVTVHYQHLNDFNYLLDNSRTGEKNLTACHRQC